MRYSFAPLALAAFAAAAPQGVTSALAPSSSPPAGCKNTVAGTFEIELVKTAGSKKRDIAARDVLTLKLNNGVLTDAKGRIGSIVANGQFQFDGPPAQTGAVYTAGWTLCPNNTLTLGGETVFYECLTSNFFNIYDKSLGGQCSPVLIQAINAQGAGVTQYSDGQPQATGAVTQYSDGQPQATGAVTQYSDGQPQAPTGNPVTQYTDGQPQAPTGNPVTQYSDGQPQAPTGSAKPTGAPVSQISDGQPQAPTSTPSKPTGAPVSQISDGQPQAPTNGTVKTTAKATATAASSSASAVATATGGAAAQGAGLIALAAGVFAAVLI